MKKNFKFISIIIGIAIIIFGALIPTIFKGKSKDSFSYEMDMTAGYYYCYVFVSSEKNYEILDADIVLKSAFNDHNKINKSPQFLSGTNLLKTKEDGKYVYQITINLTRDEFFDYSKVDSVSLSTSIGKRIPVEDKIGFEINWRIPVMVIVIVAGAVFVIMGIVFISSNKIQKNLADQARNEMAKTNPEIYTADMTDEEVLVKQSELKREKFKEDGGIASLFGIEKKKEKVCGYCGGLNSHDARKCSSCGANLTSKK